VWCGLYLELSSSGGKYWRGKYRFAGKEKRLAFGVYPDVTLKMVREKCDTARQQFGAGIDPGEARKAEKIAQAGTESFEAVAREWYGKFSPGWAANHADRSYVGSKTICFPGWPFDLPTSTPVIYDREWALIRNLRDYFLPGFFFAAQYAFNFADNFARVAVLITAFVAAGLPETVAGFELRTFAHLAF